MPRDPARFSGVLLENRIVVWDLSQSRELFKAGFYGKPLGIPKPKAADFNAPLILDLVEGYYLLKCKKLVVTMRKSGDRIDSKKLGKICEQEYVDFREKFMVYWELRKAGFVVSPGVKFGCDFAVYERGPGIDHAPFLVEVMKPQDLISATSVVLSGRLATTVRKQFIIGVADREKDSVNFVSFDWWRA